MSSIIKSKKLKSKLRDIKKTQKKTDKKFLGMLIKQLGSLSDNDISTMALALFKKKIKRTLII